MSHTTASSAKHNDTWRQRILGTTTALVLLLSLGSASAAVDSYYWERRSALGMAQDDQPHAAVEALLELAGNAANPYQRSDALEQAAMIAARAGDTDQALSLAQDIPLKPNATVVYMRLLANNQRWDEIIETYSDTDFSDWPPSIAEEAFYTRGRAFRENARKPEAQADFIEAARRSQNAQIFFDLGRIAADLGNDATAAEAFKYARLNMPDRAGWQFYDAIRSRAQILRRNGLNTLALAELDEAGDMAPGFTAVSILIDRAAILANMGENKQAIQLYQQALAVEGIYTIQENTINSALQQLRQEEM